MNSSLKSLALAASAFAVAPGVAGAATGLSDCVVKSRSEGVVLMHCKANRDDKVLVDAAKAACTPGKACNVWIWEAPRPTPNCPRAPRGLRLPSGSMTLATS